MSLTNRLILLVWLGYSSCVFAHEKMDVSEDKGIAVDSTTTGVKTFIL